MTVLRRTSVAAMIVGALRNLPFGRSEPQKECDHISTNRHDTPCENYTVTEVMILVRAACLVNHAYFITFMKVQIATRRYGTRSAAAIRSPKGEFEDTESTIHSATTSEYLPGLVAPTHQSP